MNSSLVILLEFFDIVQGWVRLHNFVCNWKGQENYNWKYVRCTNHLGFFFQYLYFSKTFLFVLPVFQENIFLCSCNGQLHQKLARNQYFLKQKLSFWYKIPTYLTNNDENIAMKNNWLKNITKVKLRFFYKVLSLTCKNFMHHI